MHHHLLVFTDEDCTKLKKRYHGLVQKLEVGSEIERHSIDDLTEAMRVILQSQKDLQPFLKQVQADPAKHYHLHLTHHDKELLNLPWQLAIDTKQYPFIHISKGSTADTVFSEYKPQPGPLRILVMISSPEDLRHNKRLSYEEEEEIILKSLSTLWMTGQVQVHFTEDGSLPGLQQKLKLQYYHIFYFSGHGIYKNDTGYLQLENPITLQSEEVKAQQLVRILKEDPSNTPPLIVLSSCQTAQGSMQEGFRGVADELMHEGVPAVIAMAFSIKDQFNIVFVGHLYEHLANKSPLAAAYSQALQDMRMQEQQQLEQANKKQFHPSQWLIPQLYLSQKVNHIVDWQAHEQGQHSIDTRLIERSNTPLLPHTADYRFIGRRRECAILFNELINAKPVLITGQGGIGKTALAEYLVKRLIIQDPSYYCFAFTEKSMGIRPMVDQLLLYLETADPQYDHSYQADNWENIILHLDYLIKKATKQCKPVWLFDNMEACQQPAGGPLAEEYGEWLNYVKDHLFSKYPVLLIGRYEIPGLEHVYNVGLNQVPFADFYRKCIQLDLRSLPAKMNVPELVDIASLLYSMFGGNYRTLEFLNEVYVNNPAKTQALLHQISKLKDVQAPANELMQDVQLKLQNFSKQLVFKELMNVLTNEELKTLHLLTYFDQPVMPIALEIQQPGKKFDADLQRLKKITLIEEHIHKETGRKSYYLAPLIRNSVDGINLPQVYFYPEQAGNYFYKASFPITLSYDDLEAAMHYYKMSRSITRLNEVGIIITNHYYRFGLFDKTLYYGNLVEEIAGDKTNGDILNNMGLTHLKYGNSKQALTYFTKFSILARKDGNEKNLADAFNAIGQTHVQLKDYNTAMEWLKKSISLSRANKYKGSEAITLSNMGMIYCELEEYDKAMEAFQQSLKIRKQANDLQGQANVLNNICRIYGDLGEHKKHRETLQEALSIAVELGNKHMQGRLLNNIGFLHMEDQDYNAALICFQKNLAISESIDDGEEIGKALTGMGLAYKYLEKHNEAIDYITKGTLVLEKFDYPGIQAEALYHVGDINIQRGDAAESLPLLEMALENYRKENKRKEEAQTLYHIGDAYLYLDDLPNAIKHLEECLSILDKVDDKETESRALIRLGQSYAVIGNADKVLETQEKNLVIQQAVGDRAGEATSLLNIATSYLEKGLPDLYLYYALEAYTIHAEANDLHGIYFMSSLLGAFLCGNYPEKYLQEGLWFWEQAYEIGIQSSAFPGVEMIHAKMMKLQQPPAKRKKRSDKKRSDRKRK